MTLTSLTSLTTMTTSNNCILKSICWTLFRSCFKTFFVCTFNASKVTAIHFLFVGKLNAVSVGKPFWTDVNFPDNLVFKNGIRTKFREQKPNYCGRQHCNIIAFLHRLVIFGLHKLGIEAHAYTHYTSLLCFALLCCFRNCNRSCILTHCLSSNSKSSCKMRCESKNSLGGCT